MGRLIRQPERGGYMKLLVKRNSDPIELGDNFEIQYLFLKPLVTDHVKQRPTLKVNYKPWSNEQFFFWCPEEILDNFPIENSKFYKYRIFNKPCTPNWEYDSDMGKMFFIHETDNYIINSNLKTKENYLNYNINVTNKSNQTAPKGWVEVCFQTYMAPSFSDGTGERTFIHLNGNWMPISKTSKSGKVEGRYKNFSLFPSSNLRDWEWPHAVFDEIPDMPLIILNSKEGKRSIGAAQIPHGMIFTNVEERGRCMHSDGYLPPIEPGETFSLNGAIIFCEGGIEETVKLYEEIININNP